MARSVVTRKSAPVVFGRRFREILGVALMALAAAIFLALTSFDSADPSFDHATAGAVTNLP